MDIVYVTKDGENPELKYSLRTLVNITHDKVWVFGGSPSWLNHDTVNYRGRSQKGSKYQSTRGHIAAACNTPEVSDPFMLWNDDFFALEDIREVPIMHRGLLSDLDKEFSETKTAWAKGIRETAAFLSTVEGVEDPLSYDTHLPLVIYKAQMRDALRIAEKIKTDAVHLRTIYGNLDPIGGIQVKDPKMFKRSEPFPDGPWLSSSDETFRHTVEPVLRFLFPNPCKYEKGQTNG